MFKVIQFNDSECAKWTDDITMLKNLQMFREFFFEQTLVGIGSEKILNLEKRSSLTHKRTFKFDMPNEANEFIKQNDILSDIDSKYDSFSLLKYNVGDFFLNHRDTDLTKSSDNLIHKYTCLIFFPYNENNEDNQILKGGELIFKHPDGLYEIKFDPSIEINKNKFVMVIFSIDMYHEVLPITNGTRFVFKKPLFIKGNNEVKFTNNLNHVDNTECLSDYGCIRGDDGDY